MSIAPERTHTVFVKLERDLRKLASERQPESVHRFRTGSRRLQTLLEDIFPDRDRNQKKLLKLLNRVRKRAGKVRDIDVQLAALRNLKATQEPRRKSELTRELIDLRTQYDKKLRKALDKKMVRELNKRLKRAKRELDLKTARDPLATAKAMLARAPRAAGTASDDLLHQYRIITKRARYAAEFAAKSEPAEQFILQLRRMQDALGDWHDWLMLTQNAAKRLEDGRHSTLLAMLRNVTGSKSRRARALLPGSNWAHPAAGSDGTAASTPRESAPPKPGAKPSLAPLRATSAA